MSDVIAIDNLRKSYGDVVAVNNISFRVKKGELFAFLGVNGAGKSTTISIMCNTLSRDGGSVVIDGEDVSDSPEKTKRKLGVVFQNSLLDKALTVKDNLRSRAALYGIFGEDFEKNLAELARLLDFGDILNRSVGKLSGGQRRRIDIARALIHKPEILILDEPTTGLDPQTRKKLWQVIEDLRKDEKMTVFLTTHYMEEAADADYVVILDSGVISAEGTPLELKNRFTGDYVNLYGVSESDVAMLSKPYEKISQGFRITVSSTAEATELILKYPQLFFDYEITKSKMDDVFLSVTGRSLEHRDSDERDGEKI